MRVRWSPEAADDFETALQRIRDDNRVAARRIAQLIYDGIGALSKFPNRGRIGRVAGTRELVFAPLPFVAVYRVGDDFVEIARVIHGAQEWPPKT